MGSLMYIAQPFHSMSCFVFAKSRDGLNCEVSRPVVLLVAQSGPPGGPGTLVSSHPLYTPAGRLTRV